MQIDCVVEMKISILAIISLLLLIGLVSDLNHNEFLSKELSAKSSTDNAEVHFVIVRLHEFVYYNFSQPFNDTLGSLRDYIKFNNTQYQSFGMSDAGWLTILSQFSSDTILYAIQTSRTEGKLVFPPNSLKQTVFDSSEIIKTPQNIFFFPWMDSLQMESLWSRVSRTNIFDSLNNLTNFEIYFYKAYYGSYSEWIVIGQAIEQPVGIDDKLSSQIENYNLFQNFPNPFNPLTNISYSLPHSGNIRLIIYNLLGEEIAHLVEGRQSAGYHSISWNASNVASGIYFYRLQAGDFVQTRKMVLLK